MNVVLSIEAVRPPLAGIGRYVWELATRLPRSPEIHSLRFLSDGLWRELPDLTHSDAALTSQPRYDWRHLLGKNPLVSKVYGKFMPKLARLQLNRLARTKDAVFHGPNFFVPEIDLPSVVTIHDLSAYYPSDWHPPTRIERMRHLIPQAVARAHIVLTDSLATQRELIQEFNVDEAKVRAVPLGVDAVYHPRTAAQLEPILQRYSLQVNSYTLFVSTIEPRKNLLRLMAAYRTLPLPLRRQYPLVLAGAQGWNSQLIHEEIERAASEGWLHYLGFLAQDDLPALYAGCRLFAYPSLYEGFGLPIAEAMASGVPVLTSNCSSMPEVADGAAILVDPLDVDAIAVALETALSDESWRAAAIQRGLCRAQQLNWDACVEQTLLAYKMARSQVYG